MYSKRSGFVLGFHGCDKVFRDKVVSKQGVTPKLSTNDYDWLGSGVYFWENDHERALDWAKNTKCQEPAVLGAVVDLGHCLDLLDLRNLQILKQGYQLLVQLSDKLGKTLPQNKLIQDVLLQIKTLGLCCD